MQANQIWVSKFKQSGRINFNSTIINIIRNLGIASIAGACLAACGGGTKTTDSANPSSVYSLEEYKSQLAYSPIIKQNSLASRIGTLNNGVSDQQAVVFDQSTAVTGIRVKYYSDTACSTLIASTLMVPSNGVSTTFPAGSYTSTSRSNFALCGLFDNEGGQTGCTGEFEQANSIQYSYEYTEAPTKTELCFTNPSNTPSGERIADYSTGTGVACTSATSCGYSQPYSLQVTTGGGDGVSGWPSYIAMGGISDGTAGQYTGRQTNAIFSYANGDGSAALVAPTVTSNYVSYAITQQTAQQGVGGTAPTVVKPVIVYYTANQSAGLTNADLQESTMAKHFTNLINNVWVVESANFNIPSKNGGIVNGSFVMNPDTLGEIELHNATAPGQPFSGTFNVNEALHTALCATTNQFLWNVNIMDGADVVGTFNQTTTGIGAYFGMTMQAYQWASGQTWTANFQSIVYNNCNPNTPLTAGITVPTFTEDFKGWIQATNWIFKQFGPHVTFGWLENPWADPSSGGSTWVHNRPAGSSTASPYATTVANWLVAESVFNGTYRPDFIAVDKYEQNDYAYAAATGYNNPTANPQHVLEADTFATGFLWNQDDFTNYLSYVNILSANIGKDSNNKNYYTLLFQIPGGHLQYTNETSIGYTYGATEPVMVFGDSTLTTNFGNVLPILLGTDTSTYNYALTSSYGTFVGQTPLTFFGDVTRWQSPRLSDVAAAGVFAILWGGGNTDGLGTYPIPNDPWLSNKVTTYFASPTNVR